MGLTLGPDTGESWSVVMTPQLLEIIPALSPTARIVLAHPR